MAFDDEKRVSHESFGYIRASRVSGQTRLFDSGLQHQHYITITIGQADQIRSFHQSHVYGKNELMQIAMTEAQFAQFITSMNVGSGAPCTLQRMNGKRVAEPPADINTKETYEAEVKEKCAKIAKSLDKAMTDAQALVKKGKAGKGELEAVLGALRQAHQDVALNFPFMQQMMAENLEKLVQQAKADINAHAVMMSQRIAFGGGEGGGMPDMTLLGGAEQQGE